MYLDVSNIKSKITVSFLNNDVRTSAFNAFMITKTPIIPEIFLFRLIRVFRSTLLIPAWLYFISFFNLGRLILFSLQNVNID